MLLDVLSKSWLAAAWAFLAVSCACAQPALTPIKTEHLHNVWQLSDRLFSGSEPEDEAAMAELAQLGIKTIVSVDGISPNTALAKKFGLRYVHIPIGYDGVTRQAGQMLTRVAREIPGKIYIHCHHGKHRGPAAAAIVCRADDGRTGAAARVILEKAGTGREYPGLWRDVEEFFAPPLSTKLPQLVERAEVQSLAAAMAKVDRTFDLLKLGAANAWQSIPDHPDISVRHESVQLQELFAEAARASKPGAVQTQLKANSALAQKLAELLRSSPPAVAQADALLSQLSSSCTACHREHRNLGGHD